MDGTEIVVVRAPKGFVDLRCGGHPMVPFSEDVPRPNRLDPNYDGGTEIGKRYALETLGIEVVCTKSGRGSLAAGTEPLARKVAKQLPSSD